jgi:glyoxylase I family protein
MHRRNALTIAAAALATHSISGVTNASDSKDIKTGLHHIGLFVPDVEKAIAFYCDGLGFTIKYRWPGAKGENKGETFSFTLAGAFLDTGDGNYLEIFPSGDASLANPDFPLNHMAFRVADCQVTYERAIAAGAKSHTFNFSGSEWDGSPMKVTTTGDDPAVFMIAFIRGPAGELIELFENARF